jgi:hypothetical protein
MSLLFRLLQAALQLPQLALAIADFGACLLHTFPAFCELPGRFVETG